MRARARERERENLAPRYQHIKTPSKHQASSMQHPLLLYPREAGRAERAEHEEPPLRQPVAVVLPAEGNRLVLRLLRRIEQSRRLPPPTRKQTQTSAHTCTPRKYLFVSCTGVVGCCWGGFDKGDHGVAHQREKCVQVLCNRMLLRPRSHKSYEHADFEKTSCVGSYQNK